MEQQSGPVLPESVRQDLEGILKGSIMRHNMKDNPTGEEWQITDEDRKDMGNLLEENKEDLRKALDLPTTKKGED